MVVIIKITKTVAASKILSDDHLTSLSFHRRIILAKTTALPMSPIHQERKTSERFHGRIIPPAVSTEIPITALIAVLITPISSVYFIKAIGDSKRFRLLRNLSIKNNAATPSRVFPEAIPADVRTVPAVVRFTSSDPRNIAGHILYPK